MSSFGVGVTEDPERMEAWVSVSGTTAECSCGWRSHTPLGVLPDAVLATAEEHTTTTGHYWPTGEES